MGQQEVYDLLKKYRKDWLNARQIAKLLDASFNTVVGNLKRLRKAGFVLVRKIILSKFQGTVNLSDNAAKRSHKITH